MSNKTAIDFIILGIIALCVSLCTDYAKASFSKIDRQIFNVFLNLPCYYKVTSGYRNRKDNLRVGGAKNSYHLKNRARDIVVRPSICRLPVLAGAIKKGLTVITYKDHLHIDNREFQKCIDMENTGLCKDWIIWK